MEPFFRKAILNKFNAPLLGKNTWDNLWKNILTSWDEKSNYCFMEINDINSPQWPERVIQQFKNEWPQKYKECFERPWEHFSFIEMVGTTQSGKDLSTTFGNTLRNLLYFYTYLITEGISEEPWKDERFFPIA